MIEQLTLEDAAAASAMSASFGWPHQPEDWLLSLRVGQGLAWREDGVLIGTVMLFPLDAEHAALGQVQVAPSAQGRGIGRRLMEAALQQAGSRNLILYATKEGQGLYERLGFVPAGLVEQWQGQVEADGEADTPPGPADRKAILALDAAATGLRRTALLDGLLHAGQAITDGQGGGYAMARRFGRGAVIGPVVARGEEAAARLTEALLRPGFQRTDIPSGLPRLSAFLHQAGLHRVATVQGMVRGSWPAGGQGMRCYALSSQAMG